MSSRSKRSLVALLACFALLFSRAALAVFACAEATWGPAAASDDHCAGKQAPSLCYSACHDDAQKYEPATAGSVPACIVGESLVLQSSDRPAPSSFSRPLQARAAAPPLILLFGRIRE